MNDEIRAMESTLKMMGLARDARFEEGKHPRAPDGKFGSGGGSHESSSESKYKSGSQSLDPSSDPPPDRKTSFTTGMRAAPIDQYSGPSSEAPKIEAVRYNKKKDAYEVKFSKNTGGKWDSELENPSAHWYHEDEIQNEEE